MINMAYKTATTLIIDFLTALLCDADMTLSHFLAHWL